MPSGSDETGKEVNQRLILIELLRGVAAAWVVLMHASGWLAAQGNPPAGEKLWSFGLVGVDIFFVISGFVIAGSYARRNTSPISFFRARLIRIVPTYWIVTGVTLATIFLTSKVGISSSWAESISPEQSLLSFFFLSGLVLNVEPVVYQGWTLEVEMAFYLVFAISILFRKWWLRPEILTLAVVALLAIAGTWMPGIAIEFCLGIVASMIYRSLKVDKGIYRILGWGIMFLGGSAMALILQSPALEIPRGLSLGVPASFLVLGAAMASRGVSKSLQMFGASSYAVYLWQVLTVPVTLNIAQSFLSEVPSIFHLAAVLVLTTVLGVITERFLDLPIRKFLTQRLDSRERTLQEMGS